MNIIETVRDIIAEFPKITELSGGVNVDFADSSPGQCGLYPTGDQLLKEDILGNQQRQHNFILYAIFNGLNEYQALANSSFLLELAYWLEKAAIGQIVEVPTKNGTLQGKLTEITSANGMLYGYQNESLTGPVTYQLQIYAKYLVESEE